MEKQYIYTLAFIQYENKLLMLNRNKQPWMGCWNGVGGKRNENESTIDCMVREIEEETTLKVSKDNLIDCGIVTWDNNDDEYSGLHVFYMNLDKDSKLITPLKVDEGILDWKVISWVSDYDNLGVSRNIPYFINDVINFTKRYDHICVFNGNDLISVTKKEI